MGLVVLLLCIIVLIDQRLLPGRSVKVVLLSLVAITFYVCFIQAIKIRKLYLSQVSYS